MEPTNPQQPKTPEQVIGEAEARILAWEKRLDDKGTAVQAESLAAIERRFIELANKVMTDRPKPMIYGKMIAIMKDIEAIEKDKHNKEGGNFMYRGIDDIYNELHQLMAKHGVISVPTLIKSHWTERKTSTGKIMFHAVCTYKYTFYAEDGSHLAAEVESEGQDTADKLTGKALSYAHKPVLLQVFMIPTKDLTDPDSQKPEDSYDQRNVPRGTSAPKTGQGQNRPPQGRTQAPPPQGSNAGKPSAASTPPSKPKPPGVGGDYVIDFTNGLAGKKLREIPIEEVEKLLVWQNTKAKVPRPEFVAAATIWIQEFIGSQAGGDVIPFDQFTGEEQP